MSELTSWERAENVEKRLEELEARVAQLEARQDRNDEIQKSEEYYE